MKMSINIVASGALIGKSIKGAKALLKEMTSNNYHWSNERATLKAVACMELMLWRCLLARLMPLLGALIGLGPLILRTLQV